MEVCRHLQDVDGGCLCIKWEKVSPEFRFEIEPVEEAEVAILSFVLKFAGCPLSSSSRLHVGHGPYDLGQVIVKGFWAEADIGATGSEEGLFRGAVAIEVGRERGFKGNFLLASRRGGSGG